MSRVKIFLILAIIAVLHAAVIYSCAYSGGKNRKTETDPELAEAIFNYIFSRDGTEQSEGVSAAKKSAQWNYDRVLKLPPELAKQSDNARSVIIVDLENRRVLYEKKSNEQVAIASLTKLMTLLVLSDQMKSNESLAWNNTVTISQAAAGVENARLQKTTYTVKDLVYSMMVGSFNDAATQLAITSHGNIPAFVDAMNARAKAMGLKQAKFNSPSGLPQKGVNSFASTAEVLYLCEAVMKNPELKKICGTPRYVLSRGSKRSGGNSIGSDNQMINGRNVRGAFGFKTGFTNAAGRCVAFGVERDGRIILCCITGYPSHSKNALFDFSVKLTDWAFKQDR